MRERGDRGPTELPGEQRPGESSVKNEASRGLRSRALVVLVLLLAAFMAYGMVTSDKGILDDVFDLVRSGLFMALGWTFGRQSTG